MASYPYRNQITNTMTESTSIEDRLFALKQQYLKSLPDKISEINQHWASCVENQTVADNLLESSLHKLAGSAGMYDETALGEIARSIEITLSNHSENLTSQNILLIESELDRLRNKITELSA